MFEVSIIIVNYNTNDYLTRCIESIFKLTSDVSYEILIVDNNSAQKIDIDLINKYCRLRIINLDSNYGFSKAVNIGISNTESKYIFLLNPDTSLLDNSCKYFYDYMEMPNSTAVWCCGGILLDDTLRFRKSYGNYPTLKNVFIEQIGINKILNIFKQKNDYKIKDFTFKEVEVPFIIGADMFVRREYVEKIGYFNESFFLNYEEAEISLRAKNRGYRSIILPEVKIMHFGSKSFKNEKEYLDKLREGELTFFKVSKTKAEFILVKTLHFIGSLLRLVFLFDMNQLSRISKIITF